MYQKELKDYCRRTRRYLPGGRKQRAIFEAYLMNCAAEFLQEQPQATFAELEAYIGTPEQAAQEYIRSLPEGVAESWLKRKKQCKRLALAAVVLLIVLLAGLVIYYYMIRGVLVSKVTIIDYGDISSSTKQALGL